MGTLPRTLVKWEIVSGYLWGHYKKVQVITKELLDLGAAIHDLTGASGNLIFETPISLMSPVSGNVSLGAYTYVGPEGDIHNATIGRFCAISPRVVIGPFKHPTNWLSTHPFQYGYTRKFKFWPEWSEFSHQLPPERCETKIGNDVWIGHSAIIMGGVKIGDGAIIGAGAVVTKNVPAYTIVGGIPAKFLKHRFPKSTAKRLAASQWWNYRVWQTQPDYKEVELILDRIDANVFDPFRPTRYALNIDTRSVQQLARQDAAAVSIAKEVRNWKRLFSRLMPQ